MSDSFVGEMKNQTDKQKKACILLSRNEIQTLFKTTLINHDMCSGSEVCFFIFALELQG